jgi:hypothetical protein
MREDLEERPGIRTRGVNYRPSGGGPSSAETSRA